MARTKACMRAGFAILFAIAMGAAVGSPSPLNGQSSYGSIVGTITDSSGAIIPGATVTVTNLGTGEESTTTSDRSGNFDVVNLNPANYKVDVEKASFKRFERQPVEVAVGATIRINSALQIGATTETIEVTTQAPLLQTDSGTLSTEIEGKTVDETPLNGRNSMNLVALAAGVVPQGSTSGGTGENQGTHTNWQGWDNYQIGGSLAGENSVYLDGAPNNSLGGNTIALIVTQDAVQEFNVTSNSQTADYGRNGGAVINMATKSGTNSFHGTAWEYLRNTVLNANEFFNKASELSSGEKNKPLQWNQDQYGVAFGGPVKKDKMFFHFTWEKFFLDSAKPSPGLVPTTSQINGQAVPASAEAVLTGALAPYNTCTFSNNGNGTYTITNLFTAGCGDPLAKIIRGYYPAPTPGYNSSGNNFYIAPASGDKQQQYNARVDYNLSNNQRLFARYTYWRLKDSGSANLGNANGFITQQAATASYSHQAILGDTYTLSPTAVLDVRLSFLHHNDDDSLPGSLGTFKNSLFAGTYYTTVADQMDENVLPNYSFGGSNIYTSDFAMNFYSAYWFNTYAIDTSLTKLLGNHNIKVGGEVRLMESENLGGGGPAINSGVFSYNGDFTGDAWTDFLLGYVYNGQGGNPGSLGLTNRAANYSWYQSYYVSDSWQATHRLTVTAGLRYELPGGLYEKHGLNTVLLPNYQWTEGAGAPSPGTSVTGALGLVDSPLYKSNSVINLHYNLFAPRIGLAYRLANNMAVRGGYGLFILPVDTTAAALAQNSPINDSSTPCGSTTQVNGQDIPDPNQLMYNCFGPAGANNDTVGNPLIEPPGRSLNGGPLVTYLHDLGNTSNSLSAPLPQQNTPYNQQWNVSVSRQLKGDVLAELGYAGAKGSNLPALSTNFNQIPDSDWLGQSVAGLTALSQSAPCAKTGTVIPVAQCDRPYPWYGNVADSIGYNASTNYNALEAKLEKRFRSLGSIMANYTWAKIIGTTDSTVGTYLETSTGIPGPPGSGGGNGIQDYDNLKAERAVLQFNAPQRAVISYVLSLPFGRGQKFGTDANGLVDHLISGWGLNGITTFQKGFHLALGDTLVRGGGFAGGENDYLGNYGFGSLRPNYTAGCSKMAGVSGSYAQRVIASQPQFNANYNSATGTFGCWTQPAAWTPGSEPRVDSNLFAEGIDNFDFAANKNTKVTEGVSLQFRAEFFNLFNRIQFAPPGVSVGQFSGPTSDFGRIFATANQPRLVQLSLRLSF